MPRENIQPDIPKSVERPILPDSIIARDDRSAILDLGLTDNMLVPAPLERSDSLPDVMVDNFSAIDATAVEAFRLLLMDKGIAVSTDETANDVKVNITNYSGKLQEVMERLSETAGVFYTYRGGLIRLSKDRSFIVPLPPLADALVEMSDIITSLGATEVKLDKSSRMVTFRASRQVFDSVSSYLERLRLSKVMIVYETYFLEVSLDDRQETGINWNQINKTSLATSVDNSVFSFDDTFGHGTPAFNIADAVKQKTVGGLGFGALFTSGSFNIDVLFEFLSSQGSVQTISRPTISIMSGGKAKFEVGSKRRYVSKVSVTNTGDNATSQSVETEDLSLGLKTEISGDYSDDTIFTSITMSIDDLITFDNVTIDDTEIALPETAARSLNTSIRVRPGDAILIGGINQSRDSKLREGPFTLGDWMPFLRTKSDAIKRSELVIVLRPRIVRFKHEEKPVAEVKPVAAIGSSALVPPQGSSNILTGVVTDPNISSQMIYMPNGTTVTVPTVSAAPSEWSQPALVTAPIVPLSSNPAAEWYQNYNTAPMTVAPERDQSAWNTAPAAQTPVDRVYDAVTAGDTYSKSPAAPSSTYLAVPPTNSGADPLADSFGYYGTSTRQQ